MSPMMQVLQDMYHYPIKWYHVCVVYVAMALLVYFY